MTIVGGIQIPHMPLFPALAAYQASERYGLAPDGPIETTLANISKGLPQGGAQMQAFGPRLAEMQPDVIVLLDSDHLNTFFLDHVPSIAVAIDNHTSGPSDHPLLHPHYGAIPLDDVLGRALHFGLLQRDFDASSIQHFTVDHSVTVPLHFLTPNFDIPIVPLYINGLVEPTISSTRAAKLGAAVGSVLDECYGDKRVVLVSSGAITLEIGGPRVFPGTIMGVPDPAWLDRVVDLLQQGDVNQLVAESTREQIHRSGNTGGEILNLIAMLSAFGGREKLDYLEAAPNAGHAYASWTL